MRNNSQVWRIVIASFASLLFADARVFASVITFSDGTFNDADWGSTVFLHGNGGTSTGTQVLSGGNPGSFWQITNVLNDAPSGDASTVWGFFNRLGAEYNPSLSGAIDWIDSSQDAIVLSGNSFQSIRVGLRQNGNVYSAGGIHPAGESWTTVTFLGLTEDDFWLVDPVTGFPIDVNDNPDFSITGSNIEFGFLRTNSTAIDGPGNTIVGGVDNWSLAVNSVTSTPEPASMALLGLTGLGGIGLRWRQRRKTRGALTAA